jgi:hypothetical protein
MIKGQDAGAAGEADLVHWFLLKGGPGPVSGVRSADFHSTTAAARADRG